MTSSTQVEIRRLPDGHVDANDFALTQMTLPEPGPGEIQVRNSWMSLDPYMRLGLTRQDGFVAQVTRGDVLNGPAIGVVEKSRDGAFPEGCHVLSQMGWRSHFIADPRQPDLKLVASDVPLEWHLGLLGLTGITAWLGIEEVLVPAKGETIFISGAAGAVGSIACQLAKRRGARVLGSAGSEEKAEWLVREVGVDAVLRYREQSVEAFVERHAPGGVDCYFDNVGGAMLESFLTAMRPGGRIGLCGAMSQYEQGDYRNGPKNFFAVIENNLWLKGFNAFRLPDQEWSVIAARLKALAQNDGLRPCQSVVNGIAQVPDAFARMFDAGHCGKLVVRI
jgi:NADPH-dependent curcumin reductase CurA